MLPLKSSDEQKKVLDQHSIEQLIHRAITFDERIPMVHSACKIGVGKRNSAERPRAQSFTRSRMAVQSEKEAGLRVDKGMSPPIEYDAGDIAFGIEARGGKHIRHLLA